MVIVTVIKPPPKAAGYVGNGVITDCGKGGTGVLGARGCGWTWQEDRRHQVADSLVNVDGMIPPDVPGATSLSNSSFPASH